MATIQVSRSSRRSSGRRRWAHRGTLITPVDLVGCRIAAQYLLPLVTPTAVTLHEFQAPARGTLIARSPLACRYLHAALLPQPAAAVTGRPEP